MPRSLATLIETANERLLVEGDLDTIPETFAKGYVAHSTRGDPIRGHKAIGRWVRAIRKAVPELRVEVEFLVQGRGRVAWQRTLTGKQDGPFKGFPATGRKLVWRDMVTSRFEDGLIAEEWVVSDLAEQLLRARKR